MQIQISWLLKKPTDLDIHCLQRQGISGYSRTTVKLAGKTVLELHSCESWLSLYHKIAFPIICKISHFSFFPEIFKICRKGSQCQVEGRWTSHLQIRLTDDRQNLHYMLEKRLIFVCSYSLENQIRHFFCLFHASKMPQYMSHLMTKPTKWMCFQQRQINLGICPVWSESFLFTQWIAKDPSFLHADSKDWLNWAEAQAELSLRWAHMPFCWFYHEMAHIIMRFTKQKYVFRVYVENEDLDHAVWSYSKISTWKTKTELIVLIMSI